MKTYDLTLKLLQNKPALRSSDKKLIWAVYMHLGYADSSNLSLDKFLSPLCPTPEAITRARRKVQENHPELDANQEVQEERRYKETFKGNTVFFEVVGSAE